jgi:hypothetical protein
MFNAENLPSGECYLEFPDGKIALASINQNARNFNIIRWLPENESIMLRVKHKISLYA